MTTHSSLVALSEVCNIGSDLPKKIVKNLLRSWILQVCLIFLLYTQHLEFGPSVWDYFSFGGGSDGGGVLTVTNYLYVSLMILLRSMNVY